MSLLSELIAELRVLLEQNHEAQNNAQVAHDQIEAALGLVRASMEDSNSDLVIEGAGQWQQTIEKLEEARTLLSAGNTAMERYIDGPLLGGAGEGGTPPGKPPTPVLSPGDRSGGRSVGVTHPALPPDPSRRPTGSPAVLDGEKTRSLELENETAIVLSRNGYEVEQLSPTNPTGKNPDYLIQGQFWDCYAPSGSSARTVHNSVHKKVSEGQASRIVLNLDDSGADVADIRARLERRPIRGLAEIKIVQGGEVRQFYPWDSEVT